MSPLEEAPKAKVATCRVTRAGDRDAQKCKSTQSSPKADQLYLVKNKVFKSLDKDLLANLIKEYKLKNIRANIKTRLLDQLNDKVDDYREFKKSIIRKPEFFEKIQSVDNFGEEMQTIQEIQRKYGMNVLTILKLRSCSPSPIR